MESATIINESTVNFVLMTYRDIFVRNLKFERTHTVDQSIGMTCTPGDCALAEHLGTAAQELCK